jgi:1,4-dihydroxy-6-naphthoate synthase
VRIRLAVSPDADDLFMVRAILSGAVDTRGDDYAIDTHPTDALNRLAEDPSPPEVLALSVAHWPVAAHRYRLLATGCSMGEGYGPVVVARTERPLASLEGRRMAVPGLSTTAWLAFRLLTPVRPVPVVIPITPPERVFEALDDGEVEAALLIHEGRLTFEDRGLTCLLELGEAWAATSGGLPLPLGANALRRDTPRPGQVAAVLRDSVGWALAHEDEVVDWLLSRGSVLGTADRVRRYLAMYANERTLDCGPDGRAAVDLLFERAVAAGLLPPVPPPEWVTPDP